LQEESNQSNLVEAHAQFNSSQAPEHRDFDQTSCGDRGGQGFRGGREGCGRGRGQRAPYCFVCGKNAGLVTRDCKYSKMAREFKEKDDASRSSEAPKHVFHNA